MTKAPPTTTPPAVKPRFVAPLFIGTENAEAVIGRDWRWCRDTATELGVPFVRIRRKLLIPADRFVEALSKCTDEFTVTSTGNRKSDADSVLTAIGMRRRAG